MYTTVGAKLVNGQARSLLTVAVYTRLTTTTWWRELTWVLLRLLVVLVVVRRYLNDGRETHFSKALFLRVIAF